MDANSRFNEMRMPHEHKLRLLEHGLYDLVQLSSLLDRVPVRLHGLQEYFHDNALEPHLDLDAWTERDVEIALDADMDGRPLGELRCGLSSPTHSGSQRRHTRRKRVGTGDTQL
jgi:hypothetical protein